AMEVGLLYAGFMGGDGGNDDRVIKFAGWTLAAAAGLLGVAKVFDHVAERKRLALEQALAARAALKRAEAERAERERAEAERVELEQVELERAKHKAESRRRRAAPRQSRRPEPALEPLRRSEPTPRHASSS